MEKREKDWTRGTRVVLTEPAQPSQPAAVGREGGSTQRDAAKRRAAEGKLAGWLRGSHPSIHPRMA